MRTRRANSAILSLTLILALGFISFCAQGKASLQVNWEVGQGVDSAEISLIGKNIRITWPDQQIQGQGLYLLFFSPAAQFLPGRATLLGATQRSFYVDPLSLSGAQQSFYKVLAFPQGLTIITDEVMIEDFEDGLVTLSSYPGQDLEPDAWEITSLATYDSSLFSLMLYGNTWKIETLSPQVISAGTVWRAAVRATQVGEIQAFGIGNGTQEYFYVFEGNTLPSGDNWNTTYHSVANYGAWALIQLPIGRDWMNTFGSLPTINRLFYVNDIDAPQGHSISFFDEIHNVTEDLPNIPQAYITAQGDSSLLQPQYQFTSLVIDPDSPAHTYFWDFGDSAFSDQPNPSHTYASRGYRTVGLTVMDDDSLFGYAAKHLLPPPGIPDPEFTMNAAGDVMMARRYAEPGGIIPTYGVNYIFQRTLPIFSQAADLSMINLETSLTDEGYPHPTKEVVYRSAPNTVNGLTFAGFDYAALGNNHTMDYMEPGMAETFRVLDTTRIQFSGSGMNDYWATRPAFLTVHGIRVGVLSYCNRDGRQDFLPPFLEAGYNKFGFAMFDEATLDATIPALDSLCDLIVVQVHAGTEYDVSPLLATLPPLARSMPEDEFIRYDQFDSDSTDRVLKQHAIDLGADLVLCHHPHVLQAFEVYQGKLIVHSFGNFAFEQTYWETYLSMILYSRARLSGFDNFTFRPVYIDDYVPTPATGELAETILRKMAAYSEIMNTDIAYDSAAGLGKIALSPAQVSESNRDIVETVNFIQEGSNWISEPLRLQDPGFLSAIVSVSGIPGGSQLRLARGREILYMGGFEYEGGWLWMNNNPDVYLESMYPHSGTFCLGVRRIPGQFALWGELEDRVPTNENTRYTVDGFVSGTNANNAALGVAFYWARTSPAAFINEQTTALVDGNFGWTRVYKNLTTPDNGFYVNVRCRNEAPVTGTSTARFDDVKLIEWTNDWTIIGTGFTSLTYPTEHTFVQLRCNQAVASATVTYRMTTRTIP
jgi:poly-gamma-glutamate capsule biosynthesis protein CapA/YwtB (metallophosphatase superfamily)